MCWEVLGAPEDVYDVDGDLQIPKAWSYLLVPESQIGPGCIDRDNFVPGPVKIVWNVEGRTYRVWVGTQDCDGAGLAQDWLDLIPVATYGHGLLVGGLFVGLPALTVLTLAYCRRMHADFHRKATRPLVVDKKLGRPLKVRLDSILHAAYQEALL